MQCKCNTWADVSDVVGNVLLHLGWPAGSVHGVATHTQNDEGTNRLIPRFKKKKRKKIIPSN